MKSQLLSSSGARRGVPRRARSWWSRLSIWLFVAGCAASARAQDRNPLGRGPAQSVYENESDGPEPGTRGVVKLAIEAKTRKESLILGSGMSGVFLREGFTRTGPPREDTAFGAGLGVTSLVYANYLAVAHEVVRSDRSLLLGRLGGGSTGFDGQLFADSAVGLRWATRPTHGPIVRLGARGWLEGNDRYYSSLVELPSVQLGYQMFRRSWLIELAARSGVALVGRFVTRDADMRALGESWTWGGHATFQLRKALWATDWTRIEAQSGPVDVLRTRVCGVVAWVLICTELERLSGELRPAHARAAGMTDGEALTAGFSLGVGQHAEPKIGIAH